MPDFSSLFKLHESKPIGVGSQKVIVISKALTLYIPGLPVGFVWNRPAAVRVQTEGAGEVTLPVTDETRRLQILLLAMGVIGSILIAALIKRR